MSDALAHEHVRRLEVGLNNQRTGRIVGRVINRSHNQGSPASATLALPNQPTATDTIDIGADTYEFQAGAADLADDANIAVEIGGDAGETRDNLIAAINATYDPNEHPTIFQTDSTTAALANGTEKVFADEVGTGVRIRNANAAGGTVVSGEQSIVLAEAITDAADIWDVGDVNMNTLGAVTGGEGRWATAELTVTAAMITNGCRLDFGFTPAWIDVSVIDSSGVVRGNGADAYTLDTDGVAIAFGGGADPDIQATDVLRVVAYE